MQTVVVIACFLNWMVKIEGHDPAVEFIAHWWYRNIPIICKPLYASFCVENQALLFKYLMAR